jgi:hypothetical protein
MEKITFCFGETKIAGNAELLAAPLSCKMVDNQ